MAETLTSKDEPRGLPALSGIVSATFVNFVRFCQILELFLLKRKSVFCAIFLSYFMTSSERKRM